MVRRKCSLSFAFLVRSTFHLSIFFSCVSAFFFVLLLVAAAVVGGSDTHPAAPVIDVTDVRYYVALKDACP
jgi:hypothetical protein